MNRIAADLLVDFLSRILRSHDVAGRQAESVARNIVWNAMVGRDNFSFVRLPVHLERLRAGVLNGHAEPTFADSGEAILTCDGDNGFGHYVGELAMARAIDRAAARGLGMVAVRNSNFFGTGAYFVNMAAEAGTIGLALSNSFPKVAAHGGTRPVLGTNPLAFGAPRRGGRHLLVDMATSALAGSTVRQHMAGATPLAEGLAIDRDGAPITEPGKVKDGALTPFGGAKGYGLALLVEILAGVLSGAGVSHQVASLYNDFERGGNSGHFLVAIDISRFMPLEAFLDRLDGLVALLHASGPPGSVRLPGEVRWQHYETNAEAGIELDNGQRRLLAELAEPFGLVAPWCEAV